MRKLISYIAVSLDGKIARADGGVDWLYELPNPDNLDYGYREFYDSIDTVIMGNSTHKVSLELAETYPTADKENFVITRNAQLTRDENVTFISGKIEAQVEALKKKEGKDIWLMGGGEVNSLMLNARLLDQLRLYVIPIILGEGIPLFSDNSNQTDVVLTSSQVFSTGVVELMYHPKKQDNE